MTRRHRFVTRRRKIDGFRSVEIATAFIDDGPGTTAKESLVQVRFLERGVGMPVPLSPEAATWIAETLLDAAAVAEEEQS